MEEFPMWNHIFTGVFAVWNLLVFFLYGWDKLCARKHWRRISESMLLLTAFLGGALGALFGMVIWNHKTSKMKFRLLVPFFNVFDGVLLWLLCNLISC